MDALENITIDEKVIDYYIQNQDRLRSFQASVVSFFEKHSKLKNGNIPIIHSIKSRLKDPEHLKDKLIRKQRKGITVTEENLFKEITDLVGVRILHLYQDQFEQIHDVIQDYVSKGDWAFVDPPKALTWDPESQEMFKRIGIQAEVRPTYYTSVHYIVKPNNENPNPICCEIQVRTLFEEIWGEIDHSINYPHPIDNIACKEQLRVLSKLVLTGNRLADSIFRTLNDSLGKN
jgi:hypothetical protein